MFRALVLEEADGKVTSSVQELDEASLPDGDVTVVIDYSTLNYKDGMILGGIGRMVRNYPHIGGIDFAGAVEESAHPDYRAGDKVVLTGWRVGEAHWGDIPKKRASRGIGWFTCRRISRRDRRWRSARPVSRPCSPFRR